MSEETTGAYRALEAARHNLSVPSAWQVAITSGVVLSLGDQVGLWEIGDGISFTELTAFFSAVVAFLGMFTRGRRTR